MTTYHVNRPSEHFSPMGTLLIAASLACVAMVLVLLLFVPVVVTVDGTARVVRAGQTVAELAAEKEFAAQRGDFVSVRGRILKHDGGGAVRFQSGGELLPVSARLYAAQALRSVPGSDTVEPVVTAVVRVDPPVTFLGNGPMQVIETTGSAGTARVRRGSVSGEVIATNTLVPALPRVVRLEAFPPNAKLVALTFDDGPWRGQTEKILKILNDTGTRATFFMLGDRVRVNPSLAKRVVADGMLIGNHSMTHKYLTHPTVNRVRDELGRAQKIIKAVTGVTPTWYRPAGGFHNAMVDREAHRLGLKVIRWNIDTSDYRKPKAAILVRRVVGGAAKHRKAIVLMHDGGGNRTQTIRALPKIISVLRAKGYYFVDLDEMSKAP
jgi:peptidoglycan-N-acetylglucosamine deacetylase